MMISLVEFFILASAGTLTAAGASHGYQLLRQPRGSRGRMPSAPGQEEGLDRPAAGAWHQPRQVSRYRMDARIECFEGDRCSLARLVDISRRGWRAQGERRLARGAVMSVNVFLPGQPMPIAIDEAVVRWTTGFEFGLELIRIKPEAATRLSEHLIARFPADRPEPSSGLSPFSYN